MKALVSDRTGNATIAELLQQVVNEERTNAATRFSSHIDGLIRHIACRELNKVEIVELLQQESVKFHNVGLNRGEAL